METTFYRFYSEIRGFISDLFRNPLGAEPSEYLTERGFSKKKLVNELISRNIIERSEKILDKSNSDNEKPTYSVRYKLYSDNFERKVKRMYTKHFEKNLPKKTDEINEEGGASSCGSVGGSFEQPLTKQVISRPLYEGKKPRRIRITEEQFNLLQNTINAATVGDIDEATTTFNIGALGDYTANGLVLTTSDGKKDPSYDR